MFFSYVASVVLLALALYGLLNIFRDIWGALFSLHRDGGLKGSILLVVRNHEQEIEGWVRHVLEETADASFWEECVIVDCASEDITPFVLDRMASRYSRIKVIHLPASARAVAEGIVHCQGDVVYVLDFASRLSAGVFPAALRRIRRPEP